MKAQFMLAQIHIFFISQFDPLTQKSIFFYGLYIIIFIIHEEFGIYVCNESF